jgi:hypothetical protein
VICREHACLFVHIPKTAGQSIEQFFMDNLGLSWESDRDHLLLGNNSDPSRGTEKLSHLSADEYVRCGYLTAAEFNQLYKFSFVRNPWERIVSEYRYRNYFHHRSFRDFLLNRLPARSWDDKYRHIMPQYDLLHDEQGQLLVDFVGRFETLQSDFDQVCIQLGIKDSELPHRNKSNKKSRNLKRSLRNWIYMNGENSKDTYLEFYDAETIEIVGNLYRKDIDAFAYPMLPGA